MSYNSGAVKSAQCWNIPDPGNVFFSFTLYRLSESAVLHCIPPAIAFDLDSAGWRISDGNDWRAEWIADIAEQEAHCPVILCGARSRGTIRTELLAYSIAAASEWRGSWLGVLGSNPSPAHAGDGGAGWESGLRFRPIDRPIRRLRPVANLARTGLSSSGVLPPRIAPGTPHRLERDLTGRFSLGSNASGGVEGHAEGNRAEALEFDSGGNSYGRTCGRKAIQGLILCSRVLSLGPLAKFSTAKPLQSGRLA